MTPPIDLAAPEALHATFRAVLLIAALLMGGAALLAWVLHRWQKARITGVLVLAVVLGSALIWAAYRANYGGFYRLTLDAETLVLHYAGIGTSQVRVPQAEVADVLFGLPGKGRAEAHACTLRIELKDGRSFRSAEFTTSVEDCKARRQHLLKTLRTNAAHNDR